MKINEISIDDKMVTFETLKSNVAATTAGVFLDFKNLTNNFSVAPQDVYSIDEIAEIMYNLKSMLEEVSFVFDTKSQTIMLLSALLNYFNTGF